MEIKKISVVICTYNGANFLREQLDSIIYQTYPVYEIIVQDDCSQDATLEIIKEYQEIYPSILLFQNKKNKGFCANFLTAFYLASGDYIASCDQDDIWENDKLEILINQMGDSTLIFSNSRIIPRDKDVFVYSKVPNISVFQLLLKPYIPGHQILFSAKVVKNLEFFINHSYPYDYLIVLLSSLKGSIKYVDRPLVKWRRHENATTFSEKKDTSREGYKGYFMALFSLFNHEKRNNVLFYFKGLFQNIQMENTDYKKLIYCMSQDSWFYLLKASFLCMKHKKDFDIKSTNKFMDGLRCFFIQLFFIDKYGSKIVK